MNDTIRLGFEVGTGREIAVPIRHMAVTGQTQESGKTTTLEALINRAPAGTSALAFVTKRGEQSFAGANRVRPYFRDRADWQFVTSLIDATLQEKNKFLRPWIMKICRTTLTLADVQRAVRDALKTAKGINEGVYTQLDAYLDLIVPEIARTPMAPSVDLVDGLNVMDLAAYSTPMQMLFIQSALDYVNEHHANTIVIVPEAWEFIPEGKGSPVKASAVTLARKGAAVGNRIWVDSQDMAGVDKVILRGCTVWIIGVQREANEIKRNLSNIPASIKRPKASDIANLDRGQFYACWNDRTVKVYVQPAWMAASDAREISLGAPIPVALRKAPTPTETSVNESEARALREENEQLRKQIGQLEQSIRRAPSSNEKAPADAPTSGHRDRGNAGSTPAGADLRIDDIYEQVKARLIDELPRDPQVMRIIASKPELIVELERQILTVDGSTPKGRIVRLLAAGFFDNGVTQGQTRTELRRTGTDVNTGTISTVFASLLKDGFVTLEGANTYRAVAGMKVNVVER